MIEGQTDEGQIEKGGERKERKGRRERKEREKQEDHSFNKKRES